LDKQLQYAIREVVVLLMSNKKSNKNMKKKSDYLSLLSNRQLKKILLIMRLSTFLLLITLVHVSAKTFSQDAKLTFSMNNVTVKEVFAEIEKNSTYKFLYRNEIVNVNQKVNIQANGETLDAVLKKLFDQNIITYRIFEGNMVVITDKSLQQHVKISGKVTDDANGEALIGVSVIVEGTTIGTVTDVKGEFTIEAAPNAVLEFSFLGYVSQKITVTTDQTNVEIKLVGDIQKLEEVVVVGYGTQKRTTITGSVAAVKGEVVSKLPVANISNALGGQVSGVITRLQGGQPGNDNADIHIRGIGTTGTNTALVVVNGVVRNDINQIDPSTIESVSILKDAAAVAPYGIGGANGVILITTKSGSEGKPTLTYNTYYGWQKPTYYPKLLNAVDYMELSNEATLNGNKNATLPFSLDVIENYATLHANDPDQYADSNTKDLVNFSVPMVKHDLQISGGSDKTKYFSGLGYYGQDGVFDKVNYKRYNFNLNLETKVTNTTKIIGSFIGSYEITNDIDPGTSSNWLFRGGYKYIPTQPIYYSDGHPGQFGGNAPGAVLNGNGYKNTKTYNSLASLTVEQQLPFIKGLSIKGVMSYDTRMVYYKGYHEPFKYWSIVDFNANPRTYNTGFSKQESDAPAYIYLTQQDDKYNTYTYQAYLNYSNTFGKHNITGLVVAEKRNMDHSMLSARRNNFGLSIDEMSMGSSDKTDFDNGGSSDVNAQIGYVYRLGWNYDSKYMFEAAGRYDGSYYFAPSKRWAYFPAFSAGWRISQENFMKSLEWVSNLKLRASWGESGNLAGSAYQYLFGYTLFSNVYSFGNGGMTQGAYVDYENNPYITWERSKKSDLALEASFWKDLLSVEMEVFYERRTDMLLNPNIILPVEYGLKVSQTNAGIMSNQGFELTLGTKKQFRNGLAINFSGNMSIAANKLVRTYETAATYNNKNRRKTNRPLNTVFGYKALGLFSTADDTNGDGVIDKNDGYNVQQFGTLHPGMIKYQDISGPDGVPDGKIDDNDLTVIGRPQGYPLMNYGFTAQASWKGFDVSAFFQGAAMTSYDIRGFITIPFNSNNSNAAYEYYNNRWTPDHQNAKYPIAWTAPQTNDNQLSSFWIKNASYLRLKNVQLGYSLPRSIMQKIKLRSVRVYVAGQNALTFSSLKFMDPESNSTTTDGTAYPNMKSFSIGANVTF
jgi:TonB-linked SusC/RagA family outer membrane protein